MPLFADDTTLVCVAPKEQLLKSMINAEMSRICTWLEINHLELNIRKSNFVFSIDLQIFILGLRK